MKKNPFDQFDQPSEYLDEGKKESMFVDNIHRRIKTKAKVKSLIPFRWMIGIAACLFMFGIYYLMIPESLSKEQLSEAYFMPYKNYQFEKTRGSEDEGILKLAYEAYDSQEYDKAIKTFESNKNKLTPLDQLYYAISLQGINQWAVAADLLSSIESHIPKEHADAWVYYNSLSLIAKEKTGESIEQLKKLKDRQSTFSPNAVKLLQQID